MEKYADGDEGNVSFGWEKCRWGRRKEKCSDKPSTFTFLQFTQKCGLLYSCTLGIEEFVTTLDEELAIAEEFGFIELIRNVL